MALAEEQLRARRQEQEKRHLDLLFCSYLTHLGINGKILTTLSLSIPITD